MHPNSFSLFFFSLFHFKILLITIYATLAVRNCLSLILIHFLNCQFSQKHRAESIFPDYLFLPRPHCNVPYHLPLTFSFDLLIFYQQPMENIRCYLFTFLQQLTRCKQSSTQHERTWVNLWQWKQIATFVRCIPGFRFNHEVMSPICYLKNGNEKSEF